MTEDKIYYGPKSNNMDPMFEGRIQDESIGFVGLGNMGFEMARNVLEGGFNTVAYDNRKDPLQKFEELGGTKASSLKELARQCRSIHLVVRDDKQVMEVIEGATGLFSSLKAEAEECIIIIHSTVNPKTCQEISKDAPDNVLVLDAPISGANPRAKSGELTLMVGGDEPAVDFYRPVFEAMSQEIFYTGAIGTGQVAKLANNTVAMANMMTTAEGIQLGEEYGLERDTLLEIFAASSADSFIVRNWDFLAEDYADVHPEGQEGHAEICEKDLLTALDLAKGTDVKLVGAAVASQEVPAMWRALAKEERRPR